jgi:hypothetical protein
MNASGVGTSADLGRHDRAHDRDSHRAPDLAGAVQHAEPTPALSTGTLASRRPRSGHRHAIPTPPMSSAGRRFQNDASAPSCEK